jgi:hypothetical protein
MHHALLGGLENSVLNIGKCFAMLTNYADLQLQAARRCPGGEN